MSTLHDLINEDGIYCSCKTDVVDTTSTSYVEVTPDVGIVLKNGDSVLRARKGDLIESLMYVDENLAVRSVTGSLHSVMFITKRLNGRDYIKAEGLVIDKSTEFNSDLVRIPIQDIRGFKGNSVDPNDVKIYDVALDGDKLSFITLFKPSMVTWNGELITVKLVGETATGNKYSATVPSVLKTNTLTVIGTGSAVTTRTVEGIIPSIEPTYSEVIVQDTISSLSSIFPENDSESVDEETLKENLYVPVITGVYGGKNLTIQVDGDEVANYEENDRVTVALGDSSVELCPFRVNGGKMEVLAPMMASVLTTYPTESIKVLANDFAVSVPNTKGDWLEPFAITGVNLYNSSDRDDEVTYDGNVIEVTRSNRDVGVSLSIVDHTGAAIPNDTVMVEYACGEEETLPSNYTMYKAGVPNKEGTLTVFHGKGEGAVTAIQSTANQLNVLIPEYGLGEVNITFNDVLVKPRPEIAGGFDGVSAVSNLQWIEATLASAVGECEIPDDKLYVPLLTNIDEQFDSLVVHISCNTTNPAVSRVMRADDYEGDDPGLVTKSAIYLENDPIVIYSENGEATITGVPYKVDPVERLVRINVFLLAYLSVVDATENVVLETESTMVALPDLSEFSGSLHVSQPKVIGGGMSASVSVTDNTIILDTTKYRTEVSFNLTGADGVALSDGTVGLITGTVDHTTHKITKMHFVKVENHTLCSIDWSAESDDGTDMSGDVIEELEVTGNNLMIIVPGAGIANIKSICRYHKPIIISEEFTPESIHAAYQGLEQTPNLTDNCYVPVLQNVRSFEGGMQMFVCSGTPARTIIIKYNPSVTLSVKDGEESYLNHPMVKFVKGVVSVHVMTLLPIVDKLFSEGGTITFVLTNGEDIATDTFGTSEAPSVTKIAYVDTCTLMNPKYRADSVSKDGDAVTLSRYNKDTYVNVKMNPSLIEEGKYLVMRLPGKVLSEGNITDVVTMANAALYPAPGGEFEIDLATGMSGGIEEVAETTEYLTIASRIGTVNLSLTVRDLITSMAPQVTSVPEGYSSETLSEAINTLASLYDRVVAQEVEDAEMSQIENSTFIPILDGLLTEPTTFKIGLSSENAYSYNTDAKITVKYPGKDREMAAFKCVEGDAPDYYTLYVNPILLYAVTTDAHEHSQTHIGLELDSVNWDMILDTLHVEGIDTVNAVREATGMNGKYEYEPNVDRVDLQEDGTISVTRYDTGYEVSVTLNKSTGEEFYILMEQDALPSTVTVGRSSSTGSIVVLQGDDKPVDITENTNDVMIYNRILIQNVGYADLDIIVEDKVPISSGLISTFNLDETIQDWIQYALEDYAAAGNGDTEFPDHPGYNPYQPMIENVPSDFTSVKVQPLKNGVPFTENLNPLTTTSTFKIDVMGENLNQIYTNPQFYTCADGIISFHAAALYHFMEANAGTTSILFTVQSSSGDSSVYLPVKHSIFKTNRLSIRGVTVLDNGIYDLQNSVTQQGENNFVIDEWDNKFHVVANVFKDDTQITAPFAYLQSVSYGVNVYPGYEKAINTLFEIGTHAKSENAYPITEDSTLLASQSFYIIEPGKEGYFECNATIHEHISTSAETYNIIAHPEFTYERLWDQINTLCSEPYLISDKAAMPNVVVPDSVAYIKVAQNVPAGIKKITAQVFNSAGDEGTPYHEGMRPEIYNSTIVQPSGTYIAKYNSSNDPLYPSYPAFKVIEGELLLSVIYLHYMLHFMEGISTIKLSIHGGLAELPIELGVPHLERLTVKPSGGTDITTLENGSLAALRSDKDHFYASLCKTDGSTVSSSKVTPNLVVRLTESGFIYGHDTNPTVVSYETHSENYDASNNCIEAFTDHEYYIVTALKGAEVMATIGTPITWANTPPYNITAHPDFSYEAFVDKFKTVTSNEYLRYDWDDTTIPDIIIPDNIAYIKVAQNVPDGISEVIATVYDENGVEGEIYHKGMKCHVYSTDLMTPTTSTISSSYEALSGHFNAHQKYRAYPVFKVINGELLLSVMYLHYVLHFMKKIASVKLSIHGSSVLLQTPIDSSSVESPYANRKPLMILNITHEYLSVNPEAKGKIADVGDSFTINCNCYSRDGNVVINMVEPGTNTIVTEFNTAGHTVVLRVADGGFVYNISSDYRNCDFIPYSIKNHFNDNNGYCISPTTLYDYLVITNLDDHTVPNITSGTAFTWNYIKHEE